MRWTHIGFDTILNIWDSGHDIIQGGNIRDYGFLIRMDHVHIWGEKEGEYTLKVTTYHRQEESVSVVAAKEMNVDATVTLQKVIVSQNGAALSRRR